MNSNRTFADCTFVLEFALNIMSLLFLMIKGFVKYFRINISDIKIERHFDDSMSSLSSSKHKVQKHKTKS